jgi:hypothetical protein
MTSIQQVNNMENYNISNMEFSSKKKIKEKIQEIEKKYLDYQPLVDKDLEFMIDIFKYHSNFKSKMKGMTDIYFAPSKEYPSTRCAHIAYGNKNTEIKKRPCDDISWTFCVKRIKVNTLDKFRLPFGSYRGKTIKEVDTLNRSYLVWILGPEFKDLTIKEQVEKYFKMNMEQKINNIMMTNPNQTTMDFEYQTNKPQKSKVQNRFRQAVAQYDIHGNIIRTYDSVGDTAKSGYNPQCVSKCLNNKIKLHGKSIFIRVKNKSNISSKIDPTPYIIIKSTIESNTPIVDTVENIIVNNAESNKESITIKPNGLRVGMFDKQKKLLEVFTKEKQIIDKFGHTSGVYDHLYGKITNKNKLKNGYKNLYFFRKLNIGQTYTLGEVYDFSQFEKSKPRKFVRNIKIQPSIPTEEIKTIPVEDTVIPVEEIKTIPVEDIIVTIEEPKRNFMQRLIYLFTGK